MKLVSGIVILVAAVGLASTAAGQTTVYRSVDKEGNVTLSDRPTPGAEKVEVVPVQTFATPAVPPPRASPAPDGEATAGGPGYRVFEIVSPADDEAIRSNAGDVTIGFRSEPGLREGDRVEILIDGERFGEPSRNDLQTVSNVDRGSHRLTARVIDASGEPIATAGPVTFHLLRAAVGRKRSP